MKVGTGHSDARRALARQKMQQVLETQVSCCGEGGGGQRGGGEGGFFYGIHCTKELILSCGLS